MFQLRFLVAPMCRSGLSLIVSQDSCWTGRSETRHQASHFNLKTEQSSTTFLKQLGLRC